MDALVAVEIKRLVCGKAGTEKVEYFGAEVEILAICTIMVNTPPSHICVLQATWRCPVH